MEKVVASDTSDQLKPFLYILSVAVVPISSVQYLFYHKNTKWNQVFGLWIVLNANPVIGKLV